MVRQWAALMGRWMAPLRDEAKAHTTARKMEMKQAEHLVDGMDSRLVARQERWMERRLAQSKAKRTDVGRGSAMVATLERWPVVL